MITGTVNRVEPRAIILDVGKGVEAILATTEQSPRRALPHRPERQGVRARGPAHHDAGPRSSSAARHKGFLRRLFELEVPEIHAGTVEIKAIAREAGQPLQGRRRAAARRASTRSAPRSASAARASSPSSPSSAARRSTSSRGTTTRPCSWPTRSRPAQVSRRRHRRGAPHRERHRARADALAGDRPRGPERPAGGH